MTFFAPAHKIFFFRFHFRAPWGTKPYVALQLKILSTVLCACVIMYDFAPLARLGLVWHIEGELGGVEHKVSLCA